MNRYRCINSRSENRPNLYSIRLVFPLVLALYSYEAIARYGCNITHKEFLIELLSEERTWKARKVENTFPIIEEIIVDKKGSVWVKTNDAESFPVFLAIIDDFETQLLIDPLSIKYNRSSPFYHKELKKFDVHNKRERKKYVIYSISYILGPDEKYCSMDKSIMLTVQIQTDIDKIEKHKFYFDKK